MCKISVIIPLFKTERFLHQCLESLVLQTFLDFEIVIIDDCSPNDNGSSIADSFRSKLPKIDYFRLPRNVGIFDNRRIGFERSHGEYITFLDSDDFYHSRSLEVLLEMAERNRLDIAYGSATFLINATGEKRPRRLVPHSTDKELQFVSLVADITPCYVWNRIYRRSILEKAYASLPQVYLNGLEDRPLVIASTYFAERIGFEDVSVINYRIHSESTMGNKDFSVMLKDFYNSFVVIKNFLIAMNAYEIYRAFFEASMEKLLSVGLNYRNSGHPYVHGLRLLSKAIGTEPSPASFVEPRFIDELIDPSDASSAKK